MITISYEKKAVFEELAHAKFQQFRHDKNFIRFMLQCLHDDIDEMYRINQRESEYDPSIRFTYDECKEQFLYYILHSYESHSIEDYMCNVYYHFYDIDPSTPLVLDYDPSYSY